DGGGCAGGLERVRERADHAHWRERVGQGRGTGAPLLGVGIATVVKASGAYGDYRIDSAQVRIAPSGHVTACTGVSPHGQGSDTTFAQIVADALGVSPSEVQVRHGDTALLPSGGGTGASRGLTVGGSALYTVVQQARQKLMRIAAHQLHCPAEAVAFQDGRVFDSQHPDHTVTFADLAAVAYNQALLPPDLEAGLEFSGTYTLPGNPYAFGAHVAVVEIDQETGALKFLRYAAVHDCGRI